MRDPYILYLRPYVNLELSLFPLYTNLKFYREIWGDICFYASEKDNFGQYTQQISMLLNADIKVILTLGMN